MEPELGCCVVGSSATAEACRRAGMDGPQTADVDLAWSPTVAEGESILARHDCALPITENSKARGTLAFRAGEHRIEITTFRGDGRSLDERILADLSHRDMTIGALAWRLGDDTIVDPHDGLEHWRERLIAPVGDVSERVREHPIRWLRYFRKAHTLGFDVAKSIRKQPLEHVDAMPPEAIAREFRETLLGSDSPGQFFLELHEVGGLQQLAPELAPQFDGRPAGPFRHHPEVGQGLHLILSLEWAVARTRDLSDDDRVAVLVAVLCHDLGKGLTPPEDFPSHHGHEQSGIPLVGQFLDRLPGLTDSVGRRLAEQVCGLHLEARRLRERRPGSLAKLYDQTLRSKDFPIRLFALAVGADSGGRRGLEHVGDQVVDQVTQDIEWIRERCGSVDVRAMREQFQDLERFRHELHAARARAIRSTPD